MIADPTAVDDGFGVMVVVVVLVVIVTVADVALELVACLLSFGVYDADIEAGLPAVVVADV